MPLVMASAMMSAATPAATPAMEMSGDHADHRLPPLGPEVARRKKKLESHYVYFTGTAGEPLRKSIFDSFAFPQRLKPESFCCIYGSQG